MRLFSAILARNEASSDRYLRRVLTRCAEFSDAVLVLDDQSTDQTVAVARECGAIVRSRQAGPAAWGAESSARKELWEFACEYATERDDWILVADADMILHGDPRPLCESDCVTGWAWPLYDLWSETHYRADGFWRGHEVPRVWMVAPRSQSPDWTAKFPDLGLHSGHIPVNMCLLISPAPPDVYWLHYSYVTPAQRREKHQQYLAKAHLLDAFQRQHAESILDEP